MKSFFMRQRERRKFSGTEKGERERGERGGRERERREERGERQGERVNERILQKGPRGHLV